METFFCGTLFFGGEGTFFREERSLFFLEGEEGGERVNFLWVCGRREPFLVWNCGKNTRDCDIKCEQLLDAPSAPRSSWQAVGQPEPPTWKLSRTQGT